MSNHRIQSVICDSRSSPELRDDIAFIYPIPINHGYQGLILRGQHYKSGEGLEVSCLEQVEKAERMGSLGIGCWEYVTERSFASTHIRCFATARPPPCGILPLEKPRRR